MIPCSPCNVKITLFVKNHAKHAFRDRVSIFGIAIVTSWRTLGKLIVSYSYRDFQSDSAGDPNNQTALNNNSTSWNVIARLATAHFPATTINCNPFARWRWIILLTLVHWPMEHRYNEHLDVAWRKWPTCMHVGRACETRIACCGFASAK